MVPEIAPYNNWTGNGSAVHFDYDFYIENASQLAVYLTVADGSQSQLTYGVDYSINIFEDDNDGANYITYPLESSSHSVLADDEIISLCLTLPISQESEYGTSSELNLKAFEYSFDYLTRLIQILNRKIERTAKMPEGSTESADELINELIELKSRVTQMINNITGEGNIILDKTDGLTIKTKEYVHHQSVASDKWEIEHNLDKECPTVKVIDTSGSIFRPPIKVINNNKIIIDLIGAMSGTAYIE